MSECINDLFNAGIKDDKLALIYKANEVNQVSVKTPFGITDREVVEKIVLQGEVFGPLLCSVQVDSFGKECIEEGKHLYTYKESIFIPPLAMIDDLLSISECGTQSVKMNSFLNTKTNIKKLQFGVEKCHKMHIGTKSNICPDLYIDNWKVEKISEIKTGIRNLQDIHDGDYKIDETESEKYLGDIITSDGKNNKNIEARVHKGIGVITQIKAILEDMSFGKFYFEISVILRNSLLLNSMLTNSEIWYDITIVKKHFKGPKKNSKDYVVS